MSPLPWLLLALTTGPTQASSLSFENVAAAWGLTEPAKRVVWADLDGDGWLDVITDARHVYLNRPRPDAPGKRCFVDRTKESGIDRRPDGGEGERIADFLILGDVDSDGDLDIFSGKDVDLEGWKEKHRADDGLRSEILLNDGKAHFSALASSGVEDPPVTSTCAVFLDYDLDGVLDLFVGNWYCHYGASYDAFPDRLYHGRGDGHFDDVTKTTGLLTRREAGHRDSARPTYGVTSGDWNNDGLPDIFVCAYGRRWNVLWRNNGDGTFTDVAESTGFDGDCNRSGHYPAIVKREAELPFRSNGNTFDCALADFDEDGDLDAFLGEITHWWAGSSSDRSTLLVNLGATEGYRFDRHQDLGIVRKHAGEHWNQGDIHTGWIDADGDGRLDLIIASGDYPDDQRLRLFQQDETHRFHEVTEAAGLDWEGCGGLSIGDADGDGDPDILIGRSLFRLSKEKRKALGGAPALWLNRGGDHSHWLHLRLRGRGPGGANTFGIGSKVRVTAGDHTFHRELLGGAGHAGHQNPPELTIGLGTSTHADLVEVHWPNHDHTVTRLENVPTGRVVTIREPPPPPH